MPRRPRPGPSGRLLQGDLRPPVLRPELALVLVRGQEPGRLDLPDTVGGVLVDELSEVLREDRPLGLEGPAVVCVVLGVQIEEGLAGDEDAAAPEALDEYP